MFSTLDYAVIIVLIAILLFLYNIHKQINGNNGQDLGI